MNAHPHLDDPERGPALRARILQKPALRRWYEEVYERYRGSVGRATAQGLVVELGSGAGFARDVLPGLVTTDVLPYRDVDLRADATALPFADCSLKAILLLNTLHHVPDVERFFAEARRCLAPGGRMLVVDQYPGWLAHLVLAYGHHEAYDPRAVEWRFHSDGPLSAANGALAWIVFVRDRARFERLFPELRITRIEPHSPLRYWLAGGLKAWSLLPGALFGAATRLDRKLARLLPQTSSFMDVEIERVEKA